MSPPSRPHSSQGRPSSSSSSSRSNTPNSHDNNQHLRPSKKSWREKKQNQREKQKEQLEKDVLEWKKHKESLEAQKAKQEELARKKKEEKELMALEKKKRKREEEEEIEKEKEQNGQLDSDMKDEKTDEKETETPTRDLDSLDMPPSETTAMDVDEVASEPINEDIAANATAEPTIGNFEDLPESLAATNNNKKSKDASKKKQSPKDYSGVPHYLLHPVYVSPEITISDDSKITHARFSLSQHTINKLSTPNTSTNTNGITHFFPIQCEVLPRLLQSLDSTHPPGDLLVSAPTGSGKTLAYAVPIIEGLLNRIVRRVRCLIVLPTRDLVTQVRDTFQALISGTELRVVGITGSTSFTNEQKMLVDPVDGSCRADIVVATPGRLLDHLRGTKGFELRFVRWLVVDEADRLLMQEYQGWLAMVLKCLEGEEIDGELSSDGNNTNRQTEDWDVKNWVTKVLRDSNTDRDVSPKAQDEEGEDELSNGTDKTVSSSATWKSLGFDTDEQLNLPKHTILRHTRQTKSTNLHPTPLQKLLFSATLTRNPQKIASLKLFNPTYVAVSGSAAVASEQHEQLQHEQQQQQQTEDSSYVLPSTLTEYMYVVPSASHKPLILLHYLLQNPTSKTLIFVNAIETARRLTRLLHHASPTHLSPKISYFSSSLPRSTRNALINSFASNKISILICSDVLTRGLDIDDITTVINYDPPLRTQTYVHRIGRTARAGRSGEAVSMLWGGEVGAFKKVVKEVQRTRVGDDGDGVGFRNTEFGVLKKEVGEEEMEGWEEIQVAYEKALEVLKKEVVGRSAEIYDVVEKESKMEVDDNAGGDGDEDDGDDVEEEEEDEDGADEQEEEFDEDLILSDDDEDEDAGASSHEDLMEEDEQPTQLDPKISTDKGLEELEKLLEEVANKLM